MVRLVPALALVFALAPASARADIPPDPDSDDAHCSLAEQCPSGAFCDYAFDPGDPDGDLKDVGADCRQQATTKGLKARCRDGGNYGGKELFCPAGESGSWNGPDDARDDAEDDASEAPKPPGPPKPGAKGCAVDGSGGGLALLALGGLLLARRRRR